MRLCPVIEIVSLNYVVETIILEIGSTQGQIANLDLHGAERHLCAALHDIHLPVPAKGFRVLFPNLCVTFPLHVHPLALLCKNYCRMLLL